MGDTTRPPHKTFKCEFTGKPHVQLFSHDVVEEYATSNTTIASKNIQNAARVTSEQGMFAPCMVGSLESQFLKMQCMLLNCKRVLDVGTFTGMSAIAMAEGCLLGNGVRSLVCDKIVESRSKPGVGADGCSKLADDILRHNAPVVTIECYEDTAKIAQSIFDKCEEHVCFGVPSLDDKSSVSEATSVRVNVGKAIDLRVGRAADVMKSLSAQ